MKKVPSEGTLRQRLDELEHRCDIILREESAAMVARHAPMLTPCYEEWVAFDIDPSPFDNSGTKKEGVSWTYLNFDGFSPCFAYLANEGYLVHCRLQEGSRHSRAGMRSSWRSRSTPPDRSRRRSCWCGWILGKTTWRTSGVARRRKRSLAHQAKPPPDSLEDWLEEAQCHGDCEEPREGKQVWTGETWKERKASCIGWFSR